MESFEDLCSEVPLGHYGNWRRRLAIGVHDGGTASLDVGCNTYMSRWIKNRFRAGC